MHLYRIRSTRCWSENLRDRTHAILHERQIKVFRGTVLVLFFGTLYAVWVRKTGIMIPCVFRLLTGFLCPGCGVTHMIMALLRGDLKDAWRSNAFLLLTGPYIIFLIICSLRAYIRMEKIEKSIENSAFVYVVALIIFGIGRNLIQLQ